MITGEEIEDDLPPPDFQRGAGGEPLITQEDGKRDRYSRVSSVGGVLEDDSGLTNWRISKALEGQAKRPELVAATLAASPYEDNKQAFTKLREDAIQAGRGSYKADLGTAVHAMSERWEQDDDYDPGDQYRPALELYSAEMRRLGLVSTHIECQFVNDEHRIAGTADRIYKLSRDLMAPDESIIPAGSLLIGDLKTGSSLAFSLPGYTIQLAGYAGGVLYDVVNNVRVDTPEINQEWAIIVHLSVEKEICEFLWVDLEVGRYGLNLVGEVKEWRRNWRRKAGYKASCVEVLLADEVEPEPEPEPVRDMAAMMRDRLERIKANPEAKAACIKHWPAGVKVAKQCESSEDWAALDKYLADIEAEFGMPFSDSLSAVIDMLS